MTRRKLQCMARQATRTGARQVTQGLVVSFACYRSPVSKAASSSSWKSPIYGSATAACTVSRDSVLRTESREWQRLGAIPGRSIRPVVQHAKFEGLRTFFGWIQGKVKQPPVARVGENINDPYGSRTHQGSVE